MEYPYHEVLQVYEHVLHMEKYKKSYKNNSFKISALTSNERVYLPDGS